MQAATYDKGIAFICEGDTEKMFYCTLLGYFCHKHGATMERREEKNAPDILYILELADKRYLVKFNVVNAISNMPKAGKWLEAACIKTYKCRMWYAFLCYDTDSYSNNVSPFFKDDWLSLRGTLEACGAIVVDLAAAAEIEDIMLCDLEGICNFLGCSQSAAECLSGRKGSAKMKKLFRNQGFSYHKGERALPLIKCLNMQKIIDTCPLALSSLEALFESP